MRANSRPLFVGIDLGTSGCRIIAIDDRRRMKAQATTAVPPPHRKGGRITQDPQLWWQAVCDCLYQLRRQIDMSRVRTMAVDGTSGTVLLCDPSGAPAGSGIMYDDRRATVQAERIRAVAEPHSGAIGTGSSLAKLLWLQDQKRDRGAALVLHQADWITGRLSGRWGHSDYNNALKLGFDVQYQCWPTWFEALSIHTGLLPEVHTPGETLGPVDPVIAETFGFATDTQIVAGTTDGVAAFLAAGASTPGQGVTSLGSTLILKLLSERPVFSPAHGVYSHRLGNVWLAGGASNTGGAVLLQHFTLDQLRAMTPALDPDHPTGLDYYPLPARGERFPVNDPKLAPRLTPRPKDDVRFFQGLLESIARIEARGYALLNELGAPKLTEVHTVGGGSHNPAWTRLRETMLAVPIHPPLSTEASFGSALIASGVIQESFG